MWTQHTGPICQHCSSRSQWKSPPPSTIARWPWLPNAKSTNLLKMPTSTTKAEREEGTDLVAKRRSGTVPLG
jgi:hypothetical protein